MKSLLVLFLFLSVSEVDADQISDNGFGQGSGTELLKNANPQFLTAGLGEATLCPQAQSGPNDAYFRDLSETARMRIEERKENRSSQ